MTSLLVIQGANDPRVVKSESDQIGVRLREKGMDIEYIFLKMKDAALPNTIIK